MNWIDKVLGMVAAELKKTFDESFVDGVIMEIREKIREEGLDEQS